MAKSKFGFDNTKYWAAHGKPPKGYGFWCFWCKKGGEVWASGSLTEAKRQAETKLRMKGVDPCVVYVMP